MNKTRVYPLEQLENYVPDQTVITNNEKNSTSKHSKGDDPYLRRGEKKVAKVELQDFSFRDGNPNSIKTERTSTDFSDFEETETESQDLLRSSVRKTIKVRNTILVVLIAVIIVVCACFGLICLIGALFYSVKNNLGENMLMVDGGVEIFNKVIIDGVETVGSMVGSLEKINCSNVGDVQPIFSSFFITGNRFKRYSYEVSFSNFGKINNTIVSCKNLLTSNETIVSCSTTEKEGLDLTEREYLSLDSNECDYTPCHSELFVSEENEIKIRFFQKVFSPEGFELGVVILKRNADQEFAKGFEGLQLVYRHLMIFSQEGMYIRNSMDLHKEFSEGSLSEISFTGQTFSELIDIVDERMERAEKNSDVTERYMIYPFAAFSGVILFFGKTTPVYAGKSTYVMCGVSFPFAIVKGFWVFFFWIILLVLLVILIAWVGRRFQKHVVNLTMHHLGERQLMLLEEREKMNDLMGTLLPRAITLKILNGEKLIIEERLISVCFIDVVGFTDLSRKLDMFQMIKLLQSLFSEIDLVMEKYSIFKVKSIGDCYMGALGVNDVFTSRNLLTTSMLKACVDVLRIHVSDLKLRIGLNTDSALAGVIEERAARFDLWGEAVNLASRMESSGKPAFVQIPKSHVDQIDDEEFLKSINLLSSNVRIKGYDGDFPTLLVSEKQTEKVEIINSEPNDVVVVQLNQ